MTKRVIVDDHDALREALAAFLAGLGIEVVGAVGNVAAGLDLVKRSEPDVRSSPSSCGTAAGST